MFDIGGLELLVVAVILIVVVGPKELPGMLRVFGRTLAKVRGMAAEFRGQFDDALREAELDEVRKTVSDVSSGVNKLNPKSAMREAMKPFADARADLKRDFDTDATRAASEMPNLDDAPGFDSPVDLDTGPEMEGPPEPTASEPVAPPKVTPKAKRPATASGGADASEPEAAKAPAAP